jgi:peroxiredoxin Q/BCP
MSVDQTSSSGSANPSASGSSSTAPLPEKSRDWSTKVFLGFLGVITFCYGIVLTYHISKPPETVTDDSGILEQCRRICLQYGLVSTGNIRQDAQAYLDVVQKQPLTDGLSVILSDSSFQPSESQPAALLHQAAPDFSLPDHTSTTQQLSVLGKDRPVVVVFYLGYGCSHCVAQLLALDKDRHYFRELDADIVAISSDAPEHTSARYKEYGEFHFPVVADVDYSVSQKWGVYLPETAEKPEFMNHGTFIVDRSGKVIWGSIGKEPFLDNKTLLHVIAKSQGLLPSAAVALQTEKN